MLLHAKSPRDVQPQNSKIRLKKHQLAMLKKCKDVESLNYKYGILADKPGAGKTYVLLSMILCDDVKGLNIIVVPQNIYTQWIQAIQAFSDDLTFTTYVNYEDISSLYYVPELPKCDIIITTALYYNIVADSLSSSTTSKMIVKRVILDEIDSIDKCVQKKIDCEMMWLVSASYAKERIETTLSSQNGIDLSIEQEVTCKCEEGFVSESFALEAPKQIDYICKSSYLDLMLKDLLDDKELQAAYASDFSLIARRTYKNVAQNDKQAIDFLIKDLRMTIDAERVKLDSYVKKGTDLNDIEMMNKDECTQIIAECIDKLANIHKKIEKYDLCVGCLDKFEEDAKKTRTFCCQNDMCSKCIDNWYNKTLYCPYCRSKVEQSLHTIVDADVGCGPQAAEISATSRDKINMLLHLLCKQTGRKVIIFSDYSKIFNTITTLLKENGMNYLELDGGNVKALDKILDEYKFGGARVLMLNSAFYGCGMNLENTTDIIFFHKTDRIMYEQVIGRAQRPGRTGRLAVHNLLYLNE
jgi:SNF2 family DNA or RNA helicase